MLISALGFRQPVLGQERDFGHFWPFLAHFGPFWLARPLEKPHFPEKMGARWPQSVPMARFVRLGPTLGGGVGSSSEGCLGLKLRFLGVTLHFWPFFGPTKKIAKLKRGSPQWVWKGKKNYFFCFFGLPVVHSIQF